MGTNVFFDNFSSLGEQELIMDLAEESIQIYGIETYYCPRTVINESAVFKEPGYAQFNAAYDIEMYIRSLSGYGGEGKFLSKFGLEIRDEMTFSCSVRAFSKWITPQTSIIRPNEGDIIYFPIPQKAFQITFVDQEAVFYQLGQIQFWDITCELFEYSNEQFNTGINELDSRYVIYSTVMEDYKIYLDANTILLDTSNNSIAVAEYNVESIDGQAENTDFENISQSTVDWSERDPFSEKESWEVNTLLGK